MMEDFILTHPLLQKVFLNSDTNFLLICVFTPFIVPSALYFTFFYKPKKKKMPSWDSASGKCFRLSMLSVIALWFSLGFSTWQHPGRNDLTPIQWLFACLWFGLLIATVAFDVKESKLERQSSTESSAITD